MPQSEHRSLERELKALKRRMDDLYSLSFPPNEIDPENPEAEEVSWEPFSDVWESESLWLLIADLPGVTEADLQVTVVENRLTISGKRSSLPPQVGLTAAWRERPSGYFSKSFPLPFTINEESVSAEFKRGVLTISIPKAGSREASSKKILVQTE